LVPVDVIDVVPDLDAVFVAVFVAVAVIEGVPDLDAVFVAVLVAVIVEVPDLDAV